jgi:hypothetical protein
MWMPQIMGAVPIQKNLRGAFGVMDGACECSTFKEMLDGVLLRNGGDFQDAAFTEDTVIRIERRAPFKPSGYMVHVKEIPVAKLKGCEPYVREGVYASDFFEDC